MPEFLLYHNNATVFAVCYYFSLLFPEIVRYVSSKYTMLIVGFIECYSGNTHSHVDN